MIYFKSFEFIKFREIYLYDRLFRTHRIPSSIESKLFIWLSDISVRSSVLLLKWLNMFVECYGDLSNFETMKLCWGKYLIFFYEIFNHDLGQRQWPVDHRRKGRSHKQLILIYTIAAEHGMFGPGGTGEAAATSRTRVFVCVSECLIDRSWVFRPPQKPK